MTPSSTISTPNFFIAGAPKAGTTSLYHHLDQHPNIYMSPLKEPAFFSSEVRAENFEPAHQQHARNEEDAVRRYLAGPMDQKRFSGIVRDWDGYLRLFAAAQQQKAIGEASVCYLWSKTAAGAIASRLPHARIVVVLRDPADRAFSQYLHSISNGLTSSSFRNCIDADLHHSGTSFGILHPMLEYGFYAGQIERYLKVFPREQLGIWLYEDTKRPAEFLSQVLQFLEVDSTFVPDTSTRYLQPQLPRMTGISQTLRRNGIWTKLKKLTPAPLKPIIRNLAYKKAGAIKIPPQDRAFLIDYYREDIHKLANLLNRDLSHWLA